MHLRYPFKHKKEYVLVVINNGSCYILETQNEKWLPNKACSQHEQSKAGIHSESVASIDEEAEQVKESRRGKQRD